MSRQIEGRKRPKRPTSFLWRLSVLTVVDVILSQFNPGSFSLSSPKKSINYALPDTVIHAFFFSSSTSKLPSFQSFYASHKAIYRLTNCYSQHSKHPSSCGKQPWLTAAYMNAYSSALMKMVMGNSILRSFEVAWGR